VIDEAVVQIAKQWYLLCKQVTVYCDCVDCEVIHEGVNYISFEKFNKKDKFNVFISWRRNFSYLIDAVTKIYWIHDLPRGIDLDDNMMNQTDWVVVLSEYHKSLLPDNVPAEKIFVSTNGLVPEQMDGLPNIVRSKYRIIYASSYDRGLEDLLNSWKDIKAAVPEAELHIYYGWNTYDIYLEEGIIGDTVWKDHMCELMMQEGVTEHGRIGHNELLIEYKKASILAYPCQYAGEINCIALSKAIACGCYPVTNDFAVLPERNITGTSVTNAAFIPAVITALKDTPELSEKEAKEYVAKMAWNNVAKDWVDFMFTPDVDTIVMDRTNYIYKNIDMGETVVDIGCNDGHMFKNTPIVDDVTHVDLDDFGLPNYVKADAQDLPFDDKQFGIAVVSEILEHVPDPVEAIKEAVRVADKVIITVPYEYEWCESYKPFMTIAKWEKETGKTRDELLPEDYANCKDLYRKDDLDHLWHIRWYTPTTLADDLEDAGVENYTLVKTRSNHWSHLAVVING